MEKVRVKAKCCLCKKKIDTYVDAKWAKQIDQLKGRHFCTKCMIPTVIGYKT